VVGKAVKRLQSEVVVMLGRDGDAELRGLLLRLLGTDSFTAYPA
jgi:hypothetical protein